ncbi:hypothetical protein VaNZ11_007311 [Volvox africanus]|uniref:Uncharacterized protein n=1 Tax=Volvox africanus TaxID=51714 RepID=A0ABQ5S3I2_9CHLO|nr:hypothetical protein VaNZ11_007311 [Volvox africanus]
MVFGRSRGSQPSEHVSAADRGSAHSRTGQVSAAPGDVKSEMGVVPGSVMTHSLKLKVHELKAHLRDRNTAVVDLRSEVDAPADVIFDLLADPHQHECIFESIEAAAAELVSEDGPVRKWRLDYRARWKFWKIGGVCENRLWMTTDRSCGTVSFVLREPGFLRTYEGTWTITGPDGKGPGACRGAGNVTATAIHPPPAMADGTRRRSSSGEALSPSSLPSANQVAISDYTEPQPHDLSPYVPARNSSSSLGGSRSSRNSLDCSNIINAFTSPSSDEASATLRSAKGVTGGDGNEGSDRSSNGACSNSRAGGVSGLTGAGIFAAIDSPFTPPPRLMTIVPPGESVTAVTDKPPSPPLPPSSSPPSHLPSRSPTTVCIRKSISPKISPPFPMNQMLKGHASDQVRKMLKGLLVATARKIEDETAEG